MKTETKYGVEQFDGWKAIAQVIHTFSANGDLETNVEGVAYEFEEAKFSTELAEIEEKKDQPLHDKDLGALIGKVDGSPETDKWKFSVKIDGDNTANWNGNAPTAAVAVQISNIVIEWIKQRGQTEDHTENRDQVE